MSIQIQEALENKTEDERVRITVYVDYEVLATLDELKAHFKRAERRSVDRSEVIRQAVRRFGEECGLGGRA